MSDSRKTEYQAYLSNPAWAWLREQVMGRANGQCEMCQKVPAVAVHHVRYPKVFADDHPDNLRALCNNCHEQEHGIRVKVMNEQMIDNAPKVDFVFRGNNNHEYRFEFLVIDGRPWIPICEVEKKLYQEDEKNGVERIGVHHGYEQLTPNGRLLAAKAATQLKPEYRMAYKGETWIRASGAMQLITKSDSAAGQAFREQLGDWLESQVMAGQQQTQAAMPDDPISQQLVMITNTAKSVLAMRADQLAMQAKQDAMAAEQAALTARQSHLEQKIEAEVQRLDQFTGGNLYDTARTACLKHGIKPTQIYGGNQTMAMVLGAWASKAARYRGISSAPKLIEGTYQVNQYPPELLAEGIRALGIQPATMH